MLDNKCIEEQICPICKKKSTVLRNTSTLNLWVECDACGTYEITPKLIFNNFKNADDDEYDLDKLASFLFYNKENTNRDFYLGFGEKNKDYYCLSPRIINDWYPKIFAEKVDNILLKLSSMCQYDGDYIDIENCIDALLFCVNKESSVIEKGSEKDAQINYIVNFLKQQGYVVLVDNYTVQLTVQALERIYELQKNQSTNKNVFVSMAFNKNTYDTREAIRQGVIDAKFSPEYIDEIIHNHQIVPEMFRLIRESRFLILEISDPNYGAYYEAGYALGLGKEVIICCKEEVFKREYKTEEEKKYEKYLKPHFDIAQKQILVWKDYQDLTKKLSEWIKTLF